MQQATLHVQHAILQVQQAIHSEINNKANLSPAELELGLSLAKMAISLNSDIMHWFQNSAIGIDIHVFGISRKGPTESCPQMGMKYLYASRSELIQVFSFQTLQIVTICN